MFVFSNFTWGFSESQSVSAINERQLEITSQIEKLPSRVIYPVGGTFGHRWGIQAISSSEKTWVKLHFLKPETLDNVVIVPEATFNTDKIRAYCLASEIRVSLLGTQEVVFEGSLSKTIHKNATPLLIPFDQPKKNITGLQIDILSHQSNDPSIGLSEVFAFHNGLNVALGSKVTASSRHSGQESKYLPKYLTDGQSSLGQPIDYSEIHRTNVKYTGFRSSEISKSKEISIELVLHQPQKIHEVRLLPDYLPVNEMISFFSGFGFPQAFRLELLDDNKDVIEVLHEGKLTNPGRNSPSFRSRGTIASSIKLSVQSLHFSNEYNSETFVLSEIQIINSENKNVALDSQIVIQGLHHTSSPGDFEYINKLNDGSTSRGKLVDLETWIKNIVLKSDLTQEMNRLNQKKATWLSTRHQTLTVLIVVLFFVILFITILTIRSRIKQKQNLTSIRRQIANDLHDEIGSNLASIGLISHSLQDIELSQELNEIVIDSEESLREMVWALSPRPISVLTKVREASSRLLSELNVDFHTENEAEWNQLNLQTKQDLLFWTKEAMNNIRKHAKAKAVSLKFTRVKNSKAFCVTIQDDGLGMDLTKQSDNIEHLTRLKARSSKLNGDFSVSSQPQHGTKVQLTFSAT